MGLTRLPQPAPTPVPTLRPCALSRIAPVGVMGCIAVGLANSAVWTLAPVYAQAHGLNHGLLAAFMSVFTLGGAVVQLPLGPPVGSAWTGVSSLLRVDRGFCRCRTVARLCSAARMSR